MRDWENISVKKKYKPKKDYGIKNFFHNKKNLKSCSDVSDISIVISDEEKSPEEEERERAIENFWTMTLRLLSLRQNIVRWTTMRSGKDCGI